MAEQETHDFPIEAYNALQVDVAKKIAAELHVAAEDCLRENAEAFSAFVRGNESLLRRYIDDREGAVDEVAHHLHSLHQQAA